MKADQDKVNAFLKKTKECRCPLCGHDEWGIAEKIFYLGEFDKGRVDLRGARFPVIPMTCVNCGNTMFISALVAGILGRGDGGK